MHYAWENDTCCTGGHQPAPEALANFVEEGSQQMQHQLWVHFWQN